MNFCYRYELHRGHMKSASVWNWGTAPDALNYILRPLYWIKYNSACAASYKNKYGITLVQRGERSSNYWNVQYNKKIMKSCLNSENLIPKRDASDRNRLYKWIALPGIDINKLVFFSRPNRIWSFKTFVYYSMGIVYICYL